MGHTLQPPRFVYRWCIDGFAYTLGTEAQARALAKPGQIVYRVRREQEALEFDLVDEPFAGTRVDANYL